VRISLSAGVPIAAAVLVLECGATCAQAAPPPPVFHRSDDSDEWVRKTFVVQSRPRRVLLVRASGDAPKTVRVARLDLNARNGSAGSDEYPVTAVFDTLQAAADAARGGDLVAVAAGRYAGFVIGDKPDAGDRAYVHFKALGRPGEVTIDRPSDRDREWMVLLQAAHHVIVQGFEIAGDTGPGLPPKGPLAGIMIDGDFGRSGKNAHHVVVVGNFSHNHHKWGLHATDSHTALLQDNLFALSCREHSAYVSDGSDNYVIRRNVFFGSPSSGLQCNIDSISSLHEVLKHPAMKAYPPEEPTRAWATGLVQLATSIFGEHNFPDGRGVNFIIEDNVMNANGRAGAAALNLAGLQDSLIQNNLMYDNHAHGIAEWDDGNPYDFSFVVPGPKTPADVTSPESLPLWGCRNNRIRNNTVLMSSEHRGALLMVNGSWGNRVRNNVIVNDQPSSLEVSSTAIYRLDSSHNVLNKAHYVGASRHSVAKEFPYSGANEMPDALKTLAVQLDTDAVSTLGVTRERIATEFLRYGEEPWVLIEGRWWRLNPDRPDFHPKAGSKMLAGRGDASMLPRRDLEGKARERADIGALRAQD
jgi:hypothetical protein